MQATLYKYVWQFEKLKVDKNRLKGHAPHKPILLLCVLEMIGDGMIKGNRIYITPQLVARFKDYWNSFVATDHTPTFALPFFHLWNPNGTKGKESFWHLKTRLPLQNAVTSSGSIKSFKVLKEFTEYAYLDQELFELLKNRENREILKAALRDKYFPNADLGKAAEPGTNYFLQIEHEMLAENPAYYRKKLEELKASLPPQEYEEERFIRSGAFREEVIKNYWFSCSVSGYRIDTTENASLIDACHIKPFSVSNDDHITNGIALCPNLHRAFDRGLISIDDNYRLLVSKHFEEHSKNPFSIKQFERKEILLPTNQKYYPLQENLSYHRNEVFCG
jgi:putative restriction endonuclease